MWPMIGQAQELEELICQTGADSDHPGPEVLLTLSPLETVPCHTGLGRSPGPLTASFPLDLSGWASEKAPKLAAIIS